MLIFLFWLLKDFLIFYQKFRPPDFLGGGLVQNTLKMSVKGSSWRFLRVFEKLKNFRIFDGLNLGLWKREQAPKFVLAFPQQCSKQGKAVF